MLPLKYYKIKKNALKFKIETKIETQEIGTDHLGLVCNNMSIYQRQITLNKSVTYFCKLATGLNFCGWESKLCHFIKSLPVNLVFHFKINFNISFLICHLLAVLIKKCVLEQKSGIIWSETLHDL